MTVFALKISSRAKEDTVEIMALIDSAQTRDLGREDIVDRME